MNINNKLIKEINNIFIKYDCRKSDIQDFIKERSLKRIKKAEKIIENIMIPNKKKDLLIYINELIKIEPVIRKINSKYHFRDHVVHALLCFIIGIYINEYFLNPLFKIKVNRFQWKLACLFHDIGYPVEIASKLFLESFTNNVSNIITDLKVDSPETYFQIIPINLENLTNNKNSLNLIQKRINEWGINIKTKPIYNQMLKSGKICHGIISSLALLKVIDAMYQKHNKHRTFDNNYYPDNSDISWNQKFFENDVVSACAAIFLHDLKAKNFKGIKIDPKKAPLAFLLKLSDTLQDWERPSQKTPEGISANKYDISIKKNKLIYTADIGKKNKDKIRKEINIFLKTRNVDIR